MTDSARIDEDFKRSSEHVLNLSRTPSNEDKLGLYALFKYASTGKGPTTERPSMWSPVDRAKWDTWAGLDTTMSKDDAKVRYIKIVMKLDPAFKAPSLDPPVAAAKPKSSPSPSPVPVPVPVPVSPTPPPTEAVEEEPKLREFLTRSPSGLSVNTRRASANTIDDATHVVLSNSPLKKNTSNESMVSNPLTPTSTGILTTSEVKGSPIPHIDIVPEHTLANQPLHRTTASHGDDYSTKLQQEADAVAYSSRQIAAARAIETNKSGRKLFIDPLARILGGEAAYEDAVLRQSKADSNAAISGTDRLAIRTRFFDERVSECARHGIHQFVFMGAGMDTRAFRSPSLSLSAGKTDPVVVFELDQQSVLDIKAKLLCGVVDRYRVRRVPIGADLSNPRDWVPKLTSAGFNTSKPTAWVMEGFIFYLSPDDANLLIKTVSALSSQKSYLIMSTCNKASLSNAQRGQTSLRQAWRSCLEDYQDLEESGWTNVMETQLGDPKANYGRYNGAIYPMNEPKYPRVIYVEALKELGTDKLPVSVTPRRSSVQSIFGSSFDGGVDNDLQAVIREGNELIAGNAVVTKWNNYAAMYNDIINLHDIFQYMAWRLVDAVEMTEASKKGTLIFVDLAAGSGIVSKTLLETYHTSSAICHLIEPSQSMVELAQRRFANESAVVFHLGTAASATRSGLPCTRVNADAVFCSASAHLIGDDELFSSASTMLKEDGSLVYNLWWHSFNETTYDGNYDTLQAYCRSTINKHLRETKEAEINWEEYKATKTNSNTENVAAIRSRESIASNASKYGLEVVKVEIDSYLVRARFILDFMVMTEDWPVNCALKNEAIRGAIFLKTMEDLKNYFYNVKTVRVILKKLPVKVAPPPAAPSTTAHGDGSTPSLSRGGGESVHAEINNTLKIRNIDPSIHPEIKPVGRRGRSPSSLLLSIATAIVVTGVITSLVKGFIRPSPLFKRE